MCLTPAKRALPQTLCSRQGQSHRNSVGSHSLNLTQQARRRKEEAGCQQDPAPPPLTALLELQDKRTLSTSSDQGAGCVAVISTVSDDPGSAGS